MNMAISSSEAQFVTFSLGEEVFAVPVEVVREILDYEEAFKIPNGPDYLLGLRNVRGQGVPTLDLRLKLGLTKTVPTAHTRVLVLDMSGFVVIIDLARLLSAEDTAAFASRNAA